MKKMNQRSIAAAAALLLSLALLAGCTAPAIPSALPESGTGAAENGAQPEESGVQLAGGVLLLKVNPEIAITYDADGNVTNIDARNEDAGAIIADYTDFAGKACKTVVSELVAAIGEAGYFVEEIEGERRQIIIEIEAGSRLPHDTFLDDVANEIRAEVNSGSWTAPVDVRGESDYGITDYGPNSDGVTDYGATDYTDYGVTHAPAAPDQTPAPTPAATPTPVAPSAAPTAPVAGHTDYGATDYGATDYNDTDYGPNADGVTDYGSDYGNFAYGSSDYGNSNYGNSDYGNSDYNNSDYGDSGYGH